MGGTGGGAGSASTCGTGDVEAGEGSLLDTEFLLDRSLFLAFKLIDLNNPGPEGFGELLVRGRTYPPPPPPADDGSCNPSSCDAAALASGGKTILEGVTGNERFDDIDAARPSPLGLRMSSNDSSYESTVVEDAVPPPPPPLPIEYTANALGGGGLPSFRGPVP
jgi:hypothetical protein